MGSLRNGLLIIDKLLQYKCVEGVVFCYFPLFFISFSSKIVATQCNGKVLMILNYFRIYVTIFTLVAT